MGCSATSKQISSFIKTEWKLNQLMHITLLSDWLAYSSYLSRRFNMGKYMPQTSTWPGEFEPEASFRSEQWDVSIKVYIKWCFKSKLCFVYVK